MAASPFPGMDPYLEQRWSSFHVALLLGIAESLTPALPDDLVILPESDVIVAAPGLPDRRVRPDDVVVTAGPAGGEAPAAAGPAAGAAGGGGAALAEPEVEVIHVAEEPARRPHRRLSIQEAAGRHVVTVIELLSPSNKDRGDQNLAYVRKIGDFLEAGVNVVELDLLRSSRRHLPWSPELLQGHDPAAYYATIWPRRQSWGRDVYPMRLRRRLPELPIPLRPGEPDARLPLQRVLEQTHSRHRFDKSLDYRRPLHPPLPPEDEAWADGLLREVGLR